MDKQFIKERNVLGGMIKKILNIQRIIKRNIKRKLSSNKINVKSKRRRYYLKNKPRFITILLVMLMCIVSLYLLVEILNSADAISSISEKIPAFAQSNTNNKNTGNIKSNAIVVIDPGHGGRDPGAISPYKDGFYEKEVTLDIGLKLKEKLEKAGIKVIMTREEDIELDSNMKQDTLARSVIANEANATFFVSIHVNSFDIKVNKGDTYNGTEIYYFRNGSNGSANEEYARIMGEEIQKATDTVYNGIKKANYSVLRMTKMPALLIETAYITNRGDHKRLESGQFREDMAEGIFKGTISILETMGY